MHAMYVYVWANHVTQACDDTRDSSIAEKPKRQSIFHFRFSDKKTTEYQFPALSCGLISWLVLFLAEIAYIGAKVFYASINISATCSTWS